MADNPKPYGDVTYADPEHGKYRIDTEAHARAALSYFSMPKNHAGYSPEQIKTIMGRIHAACKRFGIEVAAEKESASRNEIIPTERCTRASELADVNYSQRIITVIAAPYDEPAMVNVKGEMWQESFERGAWDAYKVMRPTRIRANREHDRRFTVGKAVNLWPQREEGFVAEIRIAQTPLGDETLELAKDDCVSASVGFGVMPEWMVQDRAARTRRIKTAQLDHIAFVESPAYPGASVLGVRSTDGVDLTNQQLKLFAGMLEMLRQQPEERHHETPNLDQFTGDDVFRWASERLRGAS